MTVFTSSSRRIGTRRARLICLTGIDGSGKTSLAQRLSEHLSNTGYNVHYVHGIHFNVIHKPIKKLAQRLFMRNTSERGDYLHYRETKIAASRRHGFWATLYGYSWFVDYSAQAFARITWPILRGKTVVADRYIYDLVLNVAVGIGRPVSSLSKLIDLFFILNPRPDIVFMVDTPEEVAFSRKSDIHSIEYLRERRSQYLMMAQRFGFRVLDGQASLDELLNEVLAHSFQDQ